MQFILKLQIQPALFIFTEEILPYLHSPSPTAIKLQPYLPVHLYFLDISVRTFHGSVGLVYRGLKEKSAVGREEGRERASALPLFPQSALSTSSYCLRCLSILL